MLLQPSHYLYQTDKLPFGVVSNLQAEQELTQQSHGFPSEFQLQDLRKSFLSLKSTEEYAALTAVTSHILLSVKYLAFKK